MLPTFSVNINTLDAKVIKRTASIISTLNENDSTREWAGEAYIKAVLKEDVDNINLVGYAKACDRNSIISKAAKKETSFITQDELDNGFTGVTEVVAEYVDNHIDDIISNLDESYYIADFLELREKIFFGKGYDIWRLIKLAKLDDRQAQKKLRILMDECDFRELLYYILTKSACFNKLEVVLC